MKKYFISIVLFLILCALHTTQAEEFASPSVFDSYALGDIDGQNDWAVTKYDTAAQGTIQITTSDASLGEKFAEITNNHSILVTQKSTPKNAGTLRFKMRHNKVGLFYLYAQTSDAGGQLLFSIQFTASKGILLEEGTKQTPVLSEYNTNQWYNFVIDFDQTKGAHGTFKMSIDGVDYGEHEYVNSESELFDLAQLTFGSESDGQTAVSAFTEISPVQQLLATTTATSTVSESLRRLSISFATTSITANLDDGLTVVASLDGNPHTPATTSSSTGTREGTSVGQFLLGMVASVVDVFTSHTETTSNPALPTPPPATTTPSIPDSVPIENTVPSSVQTDTQNNDVTTSSF